MRLSDISAMALRALLGTNCPTKVTLAINAGAALTVKTTGASNFIIDGLFYTKAALSAQVLTALAAAQQKVNGQSGFIIQPISTTAYYLITQDAAGVVNCIQSSFLGVTWYTADSNLPQVGTGQLPDAPSTLCPIGYIKVVTNGATTFTAATDALDKAGCTFTFQDLQYLPGTTNTP